MNANLSFVLKDANQNLGKGYSGVPVKESFPLTILRLLLGATLYSSCVRGELWIITQRYN